MDDMTRFSYTKPLHGVQLQHKLQAKSPLPCRFTLPLSINIVEQHQPFNSAPIWQLHDQGQTYSSLISLYQHDQQYQLDIQCEGTGQFTFSQQAMHVDWQPNGTSFEHYLQNTAIACWLELHNIPCVHANAMALNHQAHLFIAPSRTGKSTLTTKLLDYTFQMMTDDMAAIYPKPHDKYEIFPSWPKVRLWPDSAASLVGIHSAKSVVEANKLATLPTLATNHGSTIEVVQHQQVHKRFAKQEIEFNTQKTTQWCEEPKTLKNIYFLERVSDQQQACLISPVSGSFALILLLQNSMLADAYKQLDLEVSRLKFLSGMLQNVNVYKISYRSGIAELPEICEVIKQHALAK